MEETIHDILSFTVDDNGNVLELIKINDEGDMFFRENKHWTLLDESGEYPTIFDKELLDVTKDSAEQAISLWDTSHNQDTDVTKGDLVSFVTTVQ